MIHRTDTERKPQTQINLLTTTNEVLAERLAAAETKHARDLAAYELTVENLTVKLAETELFGDTDALTIAYMHGFSKGKGALTERVKALESDGRKKSFGEKHPRNQFAKCKCEHWQACIDCHPTYLEALLNGDE